jgi:hypothetical protein
MQRLTILIAALLALIALSTAPAAAANCFQQDGVLKCYDRNGRIYVAKPRGDSSRQYRQPDTVVRPRPYDGTGMGAFTYGCTLSRCD